MKYLCLVYCDEKLYSMPGFPEDGECLAYLDALKKNGQLIAAEPLKSVQTATTVRVRNGKVFVTEGLSPRRRSSWPAFISLKRGT